MLFDGPMTFTPILTQIDLRDWFAGQALAVVPHTFEGDKVIYPRGFALAAYEIADAMLAERERKP